MEIEFNLKKKDWLAFNKYYIDHDKLIKKMALSSSLLLPIILVVFLISDSLQGTFSLRTLIGYSLLSFISLIYFPLRIKKGALKKMNTLIQEKDNLGLLGVHRITLKDDSITKHTQELEYKLYWKSIKKLIETTNYYFLFDTTFSAIIIPKKEINNLEFDDYLKSKLKAIKHIN